MAASDPIILKSHRAKMGFVNGRMIPSTEGLASNSNQKYNVQCSDTDLNTEPISTDELSIDIGKLPGATFGDIIISNETSHSLYIDLQIDILNYKRYRTLDRFFLDNNNGDDLEELTVICTPIQESYMAPPITEGQSSYPSMKDSGYDNFHIFKKIKMTANTQLTLIAHNTGGTYPSNLTFDQIIVDATII